MRKSLDDAAYTGFVGLPVMVAWRKRRRAQGRGARLLDKFCPDNGKLAPMRQGRKVGRNEPCPCGSGRKWKHCCAR